MTSSPYDPYELGYTRATMVMTNRCNEVIRSKSQKIILVQIADCNSSA